MFSPEFMKFLINYQKTEFTPENSKKEIPFKDRRGGSKLAEILLTVNKQYVLFELIKFKNALI